MLVVAVFASSACGADWPGFRGPRGSGIAASSESAPTVWGPDTNVRWKAAVVRPGNGSPIVVAGRVLVTSAQDENNGSGVPVDGYVYRPGTEPALLDCVDPGTGRVLWSQPVEGLALWASIVKVGEFLYATGQNMTVTVYRPSTRGFEPVAVNRLAGSCNATPAVADGCIYIRANEWLYCIGNDKR